MKLAVVLVLSLVSITSFSQGSQGSEAGGPPNMTELIGFWKMVDIPDKDKLNKVNPWPQPFQWFGFYASGKVYSMMTSKDANYSAKELNEIFNNLPADKTPNYKLLGQFLTVNHPQIKDYQELWGVNLFAKDVNDLFKKGYLMMTLDDGNGNVAYYRLLKRVD
jgi:hypothetical protein